MAYLPAADIWNCLHPIERGTYVGLKPLFDNLTNSAFCAIVDPLLAASIPDPIRRQAFANTYGIVRLPDLGFPPPFDCIWLAEGDLWFYLRDYVNDNGFGFTHCDCPVFAAPGNQGGPWEVCWP